MIDEIHVTDIAEWDRQIVNEMHRELERETPVEVETKLTGQETDHVTLELHLPSDYPNLKRENIARITQKRLNKLEHDHGLSATVLTIEETDKEDRDVTFAG